MDMAPLTQQVVFLGIVLGAALGFVTRATHFCTMGAVADVVSMGSFTRLRMWALAIAVEKLDKSDKRKKRVIIVKSKNRNNKK